jgi:hypothetical protein
MWEIFNEINEIKLINLGDYTVKKVKRDKYVPLPDNIID